MSDDQQQSKGIACLGCGTNISRLAATCSKCGKARPPMTVEDWLALGVQAVQSTAKVSVSNPETGVPGSTSRVKIQANWKGWKP